jgi:hypothetical protein
MESIEISSVSDSSDAVDLFSDVSFADSTVTDESGEFHHNDGTDPLVLGLMNMVHPHLKKPLMMRMSAYVVRK